MKDILTVMKFTMKEMLRTKSFIISTLLILVLIVVGFNVPNIIKSISGDDTAQKLLIVDENNYFDGALEVLKDINLDYDITIENLSYDEIKDKIENKAIDSAVIVESGENKINIRYIVKDMSLMSKVPEDVVTTINSLYSSIQIRKLNLTDEQLKALNPDFNFSVEQTEEKEAHGNVLAIMLMSIVLFYAIYFCAYQVSMSVTTEKTSKIVETLVTSTSPRVIILGKTIGIGLVGLIQLIVVVTTAVVSAYAFLDNELLSSIFDMSTITPFLGIITIVYFILGYATYALLYALVGSTVSRPENVQSANSPIAILAVVGFYLSYFTMMNPTSNLNAFASLFPISSPFCMPFRVMMGLATGTDIAISIAILVVFIICVAHIAIKIYSAAILNYANSIKIKDMIKMYKDKQN